MTSRRSLRNVTASITSSCSKSGGLEPLESRVLPSTRLTPPTTWGVGGFASHGLISRGHAVVSQFRLERGGCFQNATVTLLDAPTQALDPFHQAPELEAMMVGNLAGQGEDQQVGL